ncbi:AAA family ATPase [Catovirus CTV1]|uniref:AAA family ATPase n=1 Tax=Catovirus CTV1 TaxID=1977631 RepID=A0A1V0S8M3_9VIRU|nr:AAA family ATPase [Catovirus CTV1]
MTDSLKYCIIASVASSVIGTILVKFGDKMYYFIENMTNPFYNEVTLDLNSSSVLCYSIKKYLIDVCQNNDEYEFRLIDGDNGPEKIPKYDLYKVMHNNEQIYIDFQDKYINIYTYTYCKYLQNKNSVLIDFLENNYNKYCTSDSIMITYRQREGVWSQSIISKPCNFNNSNLTKEMSDVLDDIDKFKNSEEEYKEKGVPYRKGYFLWGVPGSGKSTVVEIIAKKYNLSIYKLDLNSDDIDGAKVGDLISSVPENSIILIEEFDKQLKLLKSSKINKLSTGAIISSLDGIPRLSNSTILIITSNTDDLNLDPEEKEALFRPGRIDVIAKFETKLNITMNQSL